MPGPFSWDVTKPGDTDFRNVFPALDRGDKTTLAKVLGTLTPSGAPTTGWRVVQVGNQVFLTQNANYVAGQWVLDDTSVPAAAVIYAPVTTNLIQFAWSPSGVSPFTNWQTMAMVWSQTAGVNFLALGGANTGIAPVVQAAGADPNVGINLVPKGSGTVQINGQAIAQASPASPGYLRIGPITQQWGFTSITVGTANTWITQTVTFPVAFSAAAVAIQSSVVGAVNTFTSADTITATNFRASVNSTATGTYTYNWTAIGPT